MNQKQSSGSSVIYDVATYTKLWNRTSAEADVQHVIFAERTWRELVYGIARGDQDDPIAFQMAQHDIVELKAQGIFLNKRKQINI